jgi:hypothetical protein
MKASRSHIYIYSIEREREGEREREMIKRISRVRSDGGGKKKEIDLV